MLVPCEAAVLVPCEAAVLVPCEAAGPARREDGVPAPYEGLLVPDAVCAPQTLSPRRAGEG
ncbi:hypothetical protein GCM10018962_63210 [Dactylosporangium matsuzakiense]|uniref:Uncharacterized protein n=1 Tax=Dactylosporangium matsuzakiense TaxID=53360 RepID=A0A9W6KHL3_9ACTN|nr:hypothetical protein GCM10017581_026560 [Dactylosporangium matsuzakiense]